MISLKNHINLDKRNKPGRPALVLLIYLLMILNADAQYFGRNKPGYRTFTFDLIQTPNFEIYHYLKNDTLANVLSQWSEKWYQI
ncbi:MAG: hypothetical protein JXN62_05555, partial [Bacteroidales bacterium]|nr:hypothetical protein [Bacteroidales bacterium]